MGIKLPQSRKAPEKHIEYSAFLDACKERGCPICNLLGKTAERRIKELLYEEVNDRSVRQRLLDSFGFCSTHTSLLVRSGDGLGIALIYRDFMEVAQSALEKRNHKLLSPSRECPICELLKEFAQNHIDTVLRHIQDPGLRIHLTQSSGFCLPHLARLLEGLSEESTGRWLRSLSALTLKNARTLLEQFVRKHEAKHAHESMTDQERESCRDAVDMLIGMNI